MLAIKARQLGVDKEPEARRRVSAAVDLQLASILLRQATDPAVTDKSLQERYDRDFPGKSGPKEVWIRVIGAASEADAQAALDKINNGMDFASAVQAFSHDASKDAGGDLGDVIPDDLSPELRAVAFAMATGAIWPFRCTATDCGILWRLRAAAERPAPPLAEVANQLKAEIIADAAKSFILKSRDDTGIKIYGLGQRFG